MSTKLVESNFIKPYPQEALDGQLGLTCEDLAKVLKTKREHVIRKFKSHKLNVENDGSFNFTQTWVKIKSGRGRKYASWVFCVDTCKLIIASYSNDIGHAYFKYLLKCERFVNEAAPKLMERLQKAEKEIEALKRPKKRTVKKKNKMVEIVKRHETRIDMFGEVETVIVMDNRPRHELTPEEERQYKIRHIALVSKGLTNKLDYYINEPLREAKRKKLLITTSDLT